MCRKRKQRILYPGYKLLGLKFQDAHKSHMCWEYDSVPEIYAGFGYVEIGVDLCDECEGRLAKHFTTFVLILSVSILTRVCTAC